MSRKTSHIGRNGVIAQFIGLAFGAFERRRFHNPCAERIAEKTEVTASARSVQTKKNAPLDSASVPADSPPALLAWTVKTRMPASDPRSMIASPDRREESTSVPHSQTTKMAISTTFMVSDLSVP